MSTFTRNDAQLLENAFFNAIQRAGKAGSFGGGGRGNSPTPSNTMSPNTNSLGDVFSKLSGAAKETGSRLLDAGQVITTFAGQLADGNAKIGDAFDALGGTLTALAGQNTKLSGAVQFATGTIGAMATYIEDGLDTYSRLSQSGATFNESVVDMKASAALTRVTLDEFADTISKNTENLASMGMNVNKGSAAYTKFVDEFYRSGFGTELRRLGYTAKEVNELMASQMIGRRLENIEDEGYRKKLAESSMKFAKELDIMSKLTGENRQAMEERARTEAARGKRLAMVMEMSEKGIEGAYQTFEGVSKLAGPGALGEFVQDRIFAPNGQLLSEQSAKMASVVSQEFERGLVKAREIANDTSKTEAQRNEEITKLLTPLILAERGRLASSQEVRTLGMYSDIDSSLKFFEDMVTQGGRLAMAQNEILKKQGIDPRTATTEQRQSVIEEARKLVEAQTKASAGNTTDLAIQGQETLNQMRIAMHEGLIKPLDSQITKFINEVDSGLKNYKEANQNLSKDLVSALKKYADDISKAVRTDQSRRITDPSIERLTEQLKNTPGGVSEQQQVGYLALKDLLEKQAPDNTQILKNLEERAKKENVSLDQLIGDVAKKPLGEIKEFISSVGGKYDEQALIQELRKPRPQSGSDVGRAIEQGDVSLLDALRSGSLDLIAKALNITGTITGLDRAILDAFSKVPAQPPSSTPVPNVDVEVKAEPREFGTPGKINKIWDTPGLKLFEEGVKETVLTEDQLFNLVKGTKQLGIAESLNQFKSLLSSAIDIQPDTTNQELVYDFKKTEENIKSLITSQMELIFSNVERISKNEPNIGINPEQIVKSVFESNLKYFDNLQTNLPKQEVTNNIEIPKIEDFAAQRSELDISTELKSISQTLALELSKTLKPTENTNTKSTEQTNTPTTISSFNNGNTTLDDVVRGLDMLNNKMSTLIMQNEDLTRKQISAMRSVSESNIFERYTT